MPGQAFGIQPRIGKKAESERRGNTLEEAFSQAFGDFPVDRIPVQFRGRNYIDISWSFD